MDLCRGAKFFMSDSQSFVSTEIKTAGYAIVTIAREPVNSMNLELWQQLASAVSELESSPKVRGVILQSGLKKDVFTAGNDINELYAPNTSFERYKNFWVTQNTFLARLYRSPLVTVAAIRGASPAGGCATALCCDARIMTDFGTFGLNEVALGIPVPEYWGQLMVRTIGQRATERLLLSGTLASAEEALRLGLIDATVPADQLKGHAEELIQQLISVPMPARQQTKKQLRASFAKDWEGFCHKEAEDAWQMLSSPAVVAALGQVLQRLSKPK